ncbi:hypothetical protein [Salininema proteolyticum]|uniref:Uncharacterized protein n=1 Tax=Salininema proteolyticum TaxID=1607685 RepID=A0ABV8U4T1_9ACTN
MTTRTDTEAGAGGIGGPGTSRPRGGFGTVARISLVLWGLFALAYSGWWFVRAAAGDGPPSSHPSGPTIRGIFRPDWLPELALPIGLAIVALSMIAIGSAGNRALRLRTFWWVAAVPALILGFLIPGPSVLTFAGYLAAYLLPFIIVGLVFSMRSWKARVSVAVGASVLAVILFLRGSLGGGDIADMALGTVDAIAAMGLWPLVELFCSVGGILWIAIMWKLFSAEISVSKSRGADAVRRMLSPESAAKWGKVTAYVAAAGPMPYVLARMTWLTPWPYPKPDEAVQLNPAVISFGLMLGFAAVGGATLTIGLVRRWGEVWPSWMPVLAGRPVNPKAALIPGFAVAYLISAGAPAAIGRAISTGDLSLVLWIPLPIWGPALGLAVFAYGLRRKAISVVAPR